MRACASRCKNASLSRLKDGGFGCLRHAWIRSDSVPVPGWVKNLLSCDLWHAPSVALPWGEQADAGAGDRLKGDPLLCLLMAELDATLKQITAGLRFSSFQGHEAFRVLGKDNETFFCKCLCCCIRASAVLASNFLSVWLLTLSLGAPPDGAVSWPNLQQLTQI